MVIYFNFLPPANEVWGKLIYLQVCVCPQGDAIPAYIAGCIPACLAAGLGGGSPGPHSRGKLRGIWCRPKPKGEVEGDLPGGCLVLGVPDPGGAGPRGCLPLGGYLVETPRMATAAGGTHPTGMHSF